MQHMYSWHIASIKLVCMLIGEYRHKIDDKKRLALPSRFRKELGRKVVVTHGLDHCLFVYTLKEWKNVAAKLAGLSMGTASSRKFNRFMLAGASEADVDSMGRILLPDFLREYAGLKSSVVVAGVHDRVELWDDKRWNDYKRSATREADALAEKLGEIGVF